MFSFLYTIGETHTLKKPNYFLYLVSGGPVREGLTPRECGIGRTSLSPGIHDARWGTMLVVPYDYVWRGHHGIYGNMSDATHIKKILLSYFQGNKK